MHLLAATPGAISDGSEPIDPGQTPGDVVFLSAADTELAALSEARASLAEPGGQPPGPPGIFPARKSRATPEGCQGRGAAARRSRSLIARPRPWSGIGAIAILLWELASS